MSFSEDGIKLILELGEGQSVEFKESPSKLDKEIVAFANATGGAIYCGISDKGEIVGTNISNSLVSKVLDIARNCDPPINIKINKIEKNILQIEVPESENKPHQCANGFYLRIGANSQKLRASEVKNLINKGQSFFDSKINSVFRFPEDFSEESYKQYCKLADINFKRDRLEILENLSLLKRGSHLTNAGVLIFAKSPNNSIPESYLTAVRYKGEDKFSIIDRQDFKGDIINQIEEGLSFVKKHVELEYEIQGSGKRIERYKYPLVSIREALINALVHRDYSFQNSCVYLSIFSDKLEIENPGGILGDESLDRLEGKSFRRNPLLAELLYRAGYGEKLGSGLIRIRESLAENGNPPYAAAATNFFSIRFLPRLTRIDSSAAYSQRQLEILSVFNNTNKELSAKELAIKLGVSSTTITRELQKLMSDKLIIDTGSGRGIKYKMS